MHIETMQDNDFNAVMEINRLAFGRVDEANLVRNLLRDPTAAPSLSLVAFEEGRAVGHIIFSAARVKGSDASCALLAPVTVLPEFQGRGTGGALIERGCELLGAQGVQLVFVLGYPEFYRRHGFLPDAMSQGFQPTYPIGPQSADAWMVRPLVEGILGNVTGRVRCAAALDYPELWRE